VHCESYVTSESIYDLAVRDLPASGLDAASSWQLAERLWYASRPGSGGPIYNCALPTGDSCNVGSWYNQMRMEDDDDGDLSNGTPNGAAIYAAFARHEIACGEVDDPENQSLSACPNLEAPVLTVEGVNGAVELSWDPVPGAADYLVFRTELGCDYSQNVIATVAAPATSYTDDGVPNGLALDYRVQARAATSTCESPVSTCETTTAAALSAVGSIGLDRAEYGCGTTIQLTVSDANVGAASLSVTVESTTEATPENVTLFETAVGSGRYSGSIDTVTGAAVNGDGLLSVNPGDTITARYFDDDDGAGGSGERTAAATVECSAPIISGIATSAIDDRSARIQWSTDTAATSVVHYGEADPTDRTSGSSTLVANHDQLLGGLQACTVHFFSVESRDAAGNAASDDNGGSLYSFETLGQFRDGVRQCHAGEVSLEEAVVGCSNTLPIRLVDMDLNLDPGVLDTVDVPVTSTSEVAGETVTLTETGPNTSVFVGSISTGGGAPVPSDGILQAADGDLLTVSYEDADDGAGFRATSIATSDADCDHSGIFNIQVVNVTDEGATVQWSTSEPSTASIDWGETTALGNTLSSNELATDHSFALTTLPECGRFYFRLSNTDVHGNTITADAGGDPFGSNVFTIGGQFIRDDFGSNTGWTLQGEWEIDQPQGLGTGNGDPQSAFDGTQVLGHDLTGLGSFPGNYENNDESATSPIFDLSALSQVELKFRRWLNTNFGWTASIEVNNGGGWNEVWSGSAGQSSWSLQTVDITSDAAGQSAVQIRYRQRRTIGFGGNAAGWNVDRFIVRDATQSEYLSCGLCGGAPAFGGLLQADDVDPCGDSGVSLSWDAAPSWGTGNGGTYAVYRDTDPAFVPGPGNLVASGIAGTSYTDAAAPNDVTLYYVVRAENDETCSTGPNNGGVEDGNELRVAARDDTSQAPPSSIGGTLIVDTVNNAHVRLSWTSAAGAVEYKVTRADDPQGPFVEVGRVGGTFFEDRDELASGVSRFYDVTSVDACGNEAP
jgi:fibronectin type 3 domain-containing protein